MSSSMRLNPLDAAWLFTESRATPNHVGGLLQFRLPEDAPQDYMRLLMAEFRSHPNELDKIFDPFVRSADPRVGTKKGAGLGLTMTAEIMKAHGGKVLVQSRLGKGSTFTLRFPLSSHSHTSRTSDPTRDRR